MTMNIDILAVKNELMRDDKLANHVRNLLKNTKFNEENIEDITVGALNKAYTFAKTNVTISNEVGVPITPLYKSTISRRKLDFELINLIEKHSSIDSII